MSTERLEQERLLALLADRAGGEPLDAGATLDLERLRVLHPQLDDGTFERAAAALHLALLGRPGEPLPAGLRQRILEQARTHLRSRASAPAPRLLARPWLGWLAAAAAVLLLVVRESGSPGSGPATPAEVDRAGDVLAAAWTPTADPDAVGVTGEVLWSESLQSGYMRFRGLPANDPDQGQYQLWIFDGERPAEHPVDGGVFDSDGGELRVPIDAKLAVADATLFAVTYERPGGVVVSTRERLLLTAGPQ